MQFYIGMFWYSFCYLSWRQFQLSLLICSTHLDITRVSLLSQSCEWTSVVVAYPSTETTVSREMFKTVYGNQVLIYGLHYSGILCSSDSQLQTSWQHLSVPSARVQQSKKTYAQSNFYACLWSLNGLKDPDTHISALKMIQGTGNCSLLKIQRVMKVHVLVARPLMNLNWRRIDWTLSGTWLVRFFRKMRGKAVPCSVTMSGSLCRCLINSRYWRQVLGCCSTTAKQNHWKLLPHINFHSWQRM